MSHWPYFLLVVMMTPFPGQGGPGKAKVVLEAKGYIVPVRMVQVGTVVAGRVVEVRFEEGRQVYAGDVLVRLDASQQKAELEVAKAQFNNAKGADVAVAQATLNVATT